MAINPSTLKKLQDMYAAAPKAANKAQITQDMKALGYTDEVIALVRGEKAGAAALRRSTLATLLTELNSATPAATPAATNRRN